MDGEVPDPLLPASETDQGTGTAINTPVGRRDCLDLDLIVPVGILDLEDTVGGKIQNIGRHFGPKNSECPGHLPMIILHKIRGEASSQAIPSHFLIEDVDLLQ